MDQTKYKLIYCVTYRLSNKFIISYFSYRSCVTLSSDIGNLLLDLLLEDF
jgi:hypothetical protein